MLGHDLVDLGGDVVDVPLRLLDGGGAVPLLLPAGDVGLHLGDAPALLLDLIAELAVPLLVVGAVDQLQPARLARPVLLVALLPEVAPFPVAAVPPGLLEVAHC